DRIGYELRRGGGACPPFDAVGQGGVCREPDRSGHAVCALASGDGDYPGRHGNATTVRGCARRGSKRPVAAHRTRPLVRAAAGIRQRASLMVSLRARTPGLSIARPRAVVHADWWRRALPPMVERIAHRGEIGRCGVGAWKNFVALCGGELHDPILHRENGVAARNRPLTISAVTREAIADLDSTEDAARRAEHNRSVVLNRALMRAPA